MILKLKLRCEKRPGTRDLAEMLRAVATQVEQERRLDDVAGRVLSPKGDSVATWLLVVDEPSTEVRT